jgi:hypothetical protein
MGYRNAQLAMTTWARLDHRAARCLLVMALTARDRPGPNGEPPAVYWGGHDLLAKALGLCDWDQDPTESDLRVVRRVLAALVEAGAVKPLNRPRPGVRAEYQLALGP